jgi:5'-deoxynucleotidase YfbR-like HD superfamily hydrolase
MFNRAEENSYIGLGDGSVFCYSRMQRLKANAAGEYLPDHDPHFYGWALAQVRRWNGNVPISVAEHAVMVSKVAAILATERLFDGSTTNGKLVHASAYFGLHHDDHEAVFSDVPRPVKRMFTAIKEAEDKVEAVFLRENKRIYGHDLTDTQMKVVANIVKEADNEVNMWEGRSFLPRYVSKFKSSLPTEVLNALRPRAYAFDDQYINRHTRLVAESKTMNISTTKAQYNKILLAVKTLSVPEVTYTYSNEHALPPTNWIGNPNAA